MENKYTYKRPSSEQLEDFHVYVVSSNIWREKYNNMQNQDVTESLSLGFIRIHPECKIYSLREEIENQLDSPNLPQEFVFLRSVGRCLTKVKQHQEYQLKAKHFLSHFNSAKNYGSELYLLDTSLMDTSSISDSNPPTSSLATAENHQKSDIRSYETEMMPKYNNGHKTRNGLHNYNEEMSYLQRHENPSRTSYQTYRQQTPVSYKQNIYSELSFQNTMKQTPSVGYSPEEIGNILSTKPYSTTPPVSPRLKGHSVARNSIGRSSPALASTRSMPALPSVQSPYSSRRLNNERKGDQFVDSQLSEYLAETSQKNLYTGSIIRSQEERELKRIDREEQHLPPVNETELKRQRQGDRASRQKQEEEKRRRERKAQEQLELEQKEQEDWLKVEQQRKREEAAAEQKAAIKEAAAAAAASAGNEAVEAASAAAAAAAAATSIRVAADGEMTSQHHKWDMKRSTEPNFPNNTDPKELDSTKNNRKEESERLLQELETVREQRRAKERQREELVKRAKVLQARSQNKRNHARDIWKKKYYEEKKKTNPLEDQCNKLRQELDGIHRKFIVSLDPPKEKLVRVSTKKPSEKNNILIQATRLKQETEDLHRRVENAKMKLTAELKLRNQAEVELRGLKAELIQQKINLNLLRKQQIAGVVHNQTSVVAPSSSTAATRENPPPLRQSQGMYTPRRQIPHT